MKTSETVISERIKVFQDLGRPVFACHIQDMRDGDDWQSLRDEAIGACWTDMELNGNHPDMTVYFSPSHSYESLKMKYARYLLEIVDGH